MHTLNEQNLFFFPRKSTKEFESSKMLFYFAKSSRIFFSSLRKEQNAILFPFYEQNLFFSLRKEQNYILFS